MAYAEIGGADELRDVLGGPAGRAVTKERTRLHAVDREWLALSPFCILATSDADGNCDASPKGDPAGHLVHVLAKFDYEGKDLDVLGEADKALIGPPSVMSEHDADLVFPEL